MDQGFTSKIKINTNTALGDSLFEAASQNAIKTYTDTRFDTANIDALLAAAPTKRNYIMSHTAVWTGNATTATITYTPGYYMIYRASGTNYGVIVIPSNLPASAVIHGSFCQASAAANYACVHVTLNSTASNMVFRYRNVGASTTDTAFDAIYRLD